MVERLRNLCKDQGTNFSALEKELGFANGSLAKSDGKIQAQRLHALANRFNVSMEYILTGSSSSAQDELTAQERELLRVFRLLNSQGKSEAVKRITEMSMLPGYIEKNNDMVQSYQSTSAG